jgi:hypothetical protein
VTGLQSLLQQDGLEIAEEMEHATTFLEETAAMRVKISPYQHEKFGAWRTREHDDLVLPVALPVWRTRKLWPKSYFGDDGHWTFTLPPGFKGFTPIKGFRGRQELRW